MLDKLDSSIKEELGLSLTRVRSDPEHSLELELPFLQRILKEGFRLLPVMVRDVKPHVTRGLGLALAKTLQGCNAILVASTDLSHFYPQKVEETLDTKMLHRIEAFVPEGVLLAEDEGKGFAWGRGALASVMIAARQLGANHAQVLNYATSANVTGDLFRSSGMARRYSPTGSPPLKIYHAELCR